MGHWEDFWWETHKQVEELGLRTKFDEQLEKMVLQEKHKYKDSRERWSYALDRVIAASNKSNKTKKTI